MSHNNHTSFLSNRAKAFAHAFSGLWQAFKHETHLKIHVLAAIVAVSAGFYFSVTHYEWLALCLCMALVISLELINSAVERLCNKLVPQQNQHVKYIKDVAAAAVLVAAIVSVVVALIVFLPYLRV
ncbi:MAG: diacylglycerol kinase family protein [Bacteroidia bacterium]|nr:diacylglycerol kinase family protein [Bacteroidia bacterium]